MELFNAWRARACGLEVQPLPISLYCDDTSGSVSKKWNKHNSFFFKLAGLLQGLLNQEINIHFLATSNIASPVELADGIVEEFW